VDIVDTGKTTFVVMDYVEGRSLAQMLRAQRHPFDEQQVIAWGLQLCDVLSYLHNRKPPVVYRDMKPANVMLREDGTVRLVDFGIAVEVGLHNRRFAQSMGTPGYAPPEQLAGGGDAQVTCNVDVYALGATLYSLVTGHVPQRAQGQGQEERTVFEMRPIRSWNPKLSEGLERVLLRATHPDPAQRYGSVEEMRFDLEHHEWLTDAWRSAQMHKVTVFRRWLVASAIFCCVGVAGMLMGFTMRQASYEELMRSAALASRSASDEGSSPAERLYQRAIAVGTGRVEPFLRLLSVYEEDYRLSDEEDRRMRELLSRASIGEDDPQYAEFCYAMGVCYLSYFRIDYGGGSVGNAALASIEAARPWFARAIEACEAHEGDVPLPSTDLKAARTYEVIAGFYGRMTRAGIEGRPATPEHRELWDALFSSMEHEASATGEERSVEGVRARLCQVAAEVVGSPSLLAGFVRAGVAEEQVRSMLDLTRACLQDLEPFLQSEEHRRVYGPIAQEIGSCLDVAERNIDNAYHNPVVQMGAEGVGQS
jgi:serine/threonine-protein kinase